jgi:hypothetical protein
MACSLPKTISEESILSGWISSLSSQELSKNPNDIAANKHNNLFFIIT